MSHVEPPDSGGPVANLLRDRHVIPRWRSPMSGVPSLAAERKTIRPLSTRSNYWLHTLQEQATSSPTEQNLRELAAARFALGRPNSSSDELDGVIRATDSYRLKSDVLQDEFLSERSEFNARVARLKAVVRQHPSRALAWSELARSYLSVGQHDHAKQAMLCALHTAGLDRYITRSATRLWFQLDEVERAQHLLAQHPRVRHDPWLLAAEVACMSAQHKTSRLLGLGKQLIASKQHSPRDSSELASAIATVEHRFGSRKQASRLFAESLREPTDNALAQAQWAKNTDAHLKIPNAAWSVPSAFEADALSARAEGDWTKVSTSCLAWINDEPFSLQAAALGSIVCFVEGQLPQAARIATSGLQAFPNEVLLLNNRAVIRAYSEELAGAQADIDQALASAEGRTEPYLLATVGLLAYRSGDTASGAELYGLAMQWYSERKEPANALIAALYWTYEEILQGSLETLELCPMLGSYVRRIGNRDSLPEMKALLGRIDHALAHEFGVRSPGSVARISADYLDRFDLPTAVKAKRHDAMFHESQNQQRAQIAALQLD